MYKEFFGSFNQLKLSWENEEEVEVSKKKLSEIFTNNPNFWGQKECWLNYKFSNDKERMIKAIISKDICIYQYDFLEPDEPKTEYENQIYRIISEHSKSNNSNIHQLYWRAYNFFKMKGVYFTLDSVYMNLTDKHILSSYFIEDEEVYHQNTRMKDTDIMSILQKKSIIRCGAYDADSLIYNAYANDYIWIFPNLSIPYKKRDCVVYRYYAMPGTKIPCYLIEITQDFKEKLKSKY